MDAGQHAHGRAAELRSAEWGEAKRGPQCDDGDAADGYEEVATGRQANRPVGKSPPAQEAERMVVEVKVSGLAFDPRVKSHVVILKELEGERVLPIWIGTSEAQAI